jgi:hypothetical protein
MAIWCEPEFFVKWVIHLGVFAKNSGWQIALAFCFFWAKPKERAECEE